MKPRLASIEPLPNPAKLPDAAQHLLDQCIAGMRDSLGNQPRSQTEAYCQQTFSDPERPIQSSVGGTALRMVPYEPPIRTSQPLPEAVRAIGEASRAAGVPLKMFKIRFRWDGATWQHEQAIEIPENFKRLTKLRKPIDTEIAAALLAFVDTQRSEWDVAHLKFDADPDAARPGLNVLLPYPRPVTQIPPSSDLQSLFERVRDLHSRFGWQLNSASWAIDRKTPAKVSVNTLYG